MVVEAAAADLVYELDFRSREVVDGGVDAELVLEQLYYGARLAC